MKKVVIENKIKVQVKPAEYKEEIESKTLYEAFDGKTFKKESDCINYENIMEKYNIRECNSELELPDDIVKKFLITIKEPIKASELYLDIKSIYYINDNRCSKFVDDKMQTISIDNLLLTGTYRIIICDDSRFSDLAASYFYIESKQYLIDMFLNEVKLIEEW